MKYLDINTLQYKLGRSDTNIYDMVKAGLLPKPVKLGGRNAWREDLVDKAIEDLAEQQGAGWKASAQ